MKLTYSIDEAGYYTEDGEYEPLLLHAVAGDGPLPLCGRDGTFIGVGFDQLPTCKSCVSIMTKAETARKLAFGALSLLGSELDTKDRLVILEVLVAAQELDSAAVSVLMRQFQSCGEWADDYTYLYT